LAAPTERLFPLALFAHVHRLAPLFRSKEAVQTDATAISVPAFEIIEAEESKTETSDRLPETTLFARTILTLEDKKINIYIFIK